MLLNDIVLILYVNSKLNSIAQIPINILGGEAWAIVLHIENPSIMGADPMLSGICLQSGISLLNSSLGTLQKSI